MQDVQEQYTTIAPTAAPTEAIAVPTDGPTTTAQGELWNMTQRDFLDLVERGGFDDQPTMAEETHQAFQEMGSYVAGAL
jgi:hypothetical protein